MSEPIKPILDDFGAQIGENRWLDSAGLEGIREPGQSGDRRNPLGDFPTGPDVGERLPAVSALAHTGIVVDFDEFRSDRPGVVMFLRSAVW